LAEGKSKHYDIAVIGAGPAGMMSAGMAADSGADVILIEKNSSPGKKLLITGKGRCNITNAMDDMGGFVDIFGRNGKFLYPSLNALSIDDTIRFFNDRGLETKTERGRRVFPVSANSQDVLHVLTGFLDKSGVKVQFNSPVTDILKKEQAIDNIRTGRQDISADKYIICTGGLSYPGTGSTGDGYKWAGKLGHNIITPRPMLVPVELSEHWIKEVNGLGLKNVNIEVYFNNKKQDERFGEASFLTGAITGPVILDMSKKIKDVLDKGSDPVFLHLDLKPALDHGTLDRRIQKDLEDNRNKSLKNSLHRLLPKKIIPVILELSGVDPDRKCAQIKKEERRALVNQIKCIKLKAAGSAGFNNAVITSGGVDLREVDHKTMRSKIIENLYFAGEILDLDGPTGGYNLQVCWSTGCLAGISAASG